MIFSILTIIVCSLLVLVILVQNSKGGGIQSQYGAATQIMGVKRGTEFIEKATWGLAIVLILLSAQSPNLMVPPVPNNEVRLESTETSVAPGRWKRCSNAVCVFNIASFVPFT